MACILPQTERGLPLLPLGRLGEVFVGLKALGFLRISKVAEEVGLDESLARGRKDLPEPDWQRKAQM